MLYGIVADRPQPERLAHGRMDVIEPKGLEQPENLDIFPLAGLAHAGLEQAMQGGERLGQVPALQWCGLVKGAGLLLEQRQIMQRVEDEVLPCIGALVPRDGLGATADDDL